MSTLHTRQRRDTERSLLDTLALPVMAALVTLGAAVCALVYSVGAGVLLASSHRLPAASYFAGLGIAQRLTHDPARPWRAWPRPDRAAMSHDAVAWYAAASLPFLACLVLLGGLALVAARIWQSGAGRDQRRALGRAPTSQTAPGKPRMRLTGRPAASDGRITLGQTSLGRSVRTRPRGPRDGGRPTRTAQDHRHRHPRHPRAPRGRARRVHQARRADRHPCGARKARRDLRLRPLRRALLCLEPRRWLPGLGGRDAARGGPYNRRKAGSDNALPASGGTASPATSSRHFCTQPHSTQSPCTRSSRGSRRETQRHPGASSLPSPPRKRTRAGDSRARSTNSMPSASATTAHAPPPGSAPASYSRPTATPPSHAHPDRFPPEHAARHPRDALHHRQRRAPAAPPSDHRRAHRSHLPGRHRARKSRRTRSPAADGARRDREHRAAASSARVSRAEPRRGHHDDDGLARPLPDPRALRRPGRDDHPKQRCEGLPRRLERPPHTGIPRRLASPART